MTDVDERECQLAELLTHFEKMKPARLNAIHARIVKKTPRRPKTSCCTPQSKLIENWRPKNVAKTSKALLLILDGAGIKEAPFTVSDGWQFKFFTSEIAQRLVHGDGQVASQRSAMAQTALMVSSLAARVVERAREIHVNVQSPQCTGTHSSPCKEAAMIPDGANRPLVEAVWSRTNAEWCCLRPLSRICLTALP